MIIADGFCTIGKAGTPAARRSAPMSEQQVRTMREELLALGMTEEKVEAYMAEVEAAAKRI